MNIVLTNDDGIGCEGLMGLARALWGQGRHQVYIVAPDGNRSGVSHSISLLSPTKFKQHSEKVYTCSGTPADCVLLTALGALPVIPDLVVSGINEGINVGTDIIFSGTAAGARHAALHGIAAIALSLYSPNGEYHWGHAVEYAVENLDFLYSLWRKDVFINVNIPDMESGFMDYEITFPSERKYRDILVPFNSPDGQLYYFINGGAVDIDTEEGSDWNAVRNKRVSISPVYALPVVRRDLCETAPDYCSTAPRASVAASKKN